MTNTHIDCVFAAIPYTETDNPMMAPAILKSIAQAAGKTAVALDLNAELRDKLINHPRKNEIKSFLLTEDIYQPELTTDVFELLEFMVDRILQYNPRIVGLSVFTHDCRVATRYVAWMIRKIDPSITIIVGGAGITATVAGKATFSETLKNQNLIDFYVYGDAEKVLYEYLTTKNTNIHGINTHSWNQMTNQELSELPYPDYDDYNFSLYEEPVVLTITGSRGCVRQCTYCDYHVHWKKFTYRTGENMFQEMLSLSKKYNLRTFRFSDSLINGNMKEYRNLMRLIADHNKDLPEEEKLTWDSLFIIRPKANFTEEDWKLTIDGGARNLMIGIEVLNDQMRKDLGKNFTNEDIDFSFQMAQKYGKVKFLLLFLTGYINETYEDIEFRKQWFRENIKYKDVMVAVNVGFTLGIFENTPLDDQFEELGLIRTGPHYCDWTNPATGSTREVREKWHQELIDVVYKELNYPMPSNRVDNHTILDGIRKNHESTCNV